MGKLVSAAGMNALVTGASSDECDSCPLVGEAKGQPPSDPARGARNKRVHPRCRYQLCHAIYSLSVPLALWLVRCADAMPFPYDTCREEGSWLHA